MRALIIALISLSLYVPLSSRVALMNENDEMLKIGEEVAERNHIHCLLATSGNGHYRQRGLRFTSDQQLTLEEGEKLIAQVVADFIEQVIQNKSREENWLETTFKNSPEHKEEYDFANHPFASRWFFVRLAFWDANVERPPFPYIAQIEVEHDKVQFCYADPKTQKLSKPIEKDLPSLLAKYVMQKNDSTSESK